MVRRSTLRPYIIGCDLVFELSFFKQEEEEKKNMNEAERKKTNQIQKVFVNVIEGDKAINRQKKKKKICNRIL